MPLSAPVRELKRRARLLARSQDIPLHAALDRIARGEGFAGWSLLSSRQRTSVSPFPPLPRLVPGDLVLLAARPGQGKTRLGLQLLLEAARDGRRAVFLTLEYTERETRERIRSLASGGAAGDDVEIVASDDICAEVVGRHLAGSAPGTVAVIDYLQILDQRRSKPPLPDQMCALRRLATANGFVLAFVSQVDRSFDPAGSALPGLEDVRLPNPFDIRVFSKACFLHGGRTRLQDVA